MIAYLSLTYISLIAVDTTMVLGAVMGLSMWIVSDHLEYCCAVAASLFHGNALSWYCMSCKCNPGTIPKSLINLRMLLQCSLQ